MSRITMERNGPMQNGSSRIPRFDHGNRNMVSSNTFNNFQPLPGVGASQKPSKLEQMQMEYQRNILKEKEDKLISMFEENQKRALNKVNQNKGGVVREFFNERRSGSGSSKNSMTPTIEQLYQQKKMENQFGQQNGYMGNGSPGLNKPVAKHPSLNRGNLRDKRPSAGRDRANPLAPIQHNNQESENPFNKRKAQIVRPRTYKGAQANRDYQENITAPKSAPNGYHNDDFNDYPDEESPLPSSKQLQHLQQKRKMLQDQRQTNKMRLAQQNGSNNKTRKTPQSHRNQYEYESTEDEGYDEANDNGNSAAEDEIKRKQQELLAQIEAQQRELDRLRNERMNAEQEEKREIERRKKLEEERRKRRIEEEKRRQKEEEEERMRQQWEEEKQQKIEMEKRRMRNKSNENSKTNNRYNNSQYEEPNSPSPPPEHHGYYEQEPTPPPQPRPSNTRKIMPKKQPPKPRSPSPLPKGDHVAMYAHADQIEGAYENVGRLKACFNCGRKFAEDRIGKHEKSCKNLTKKRKVMDPSKLRTRGTEMEQYQGHRQPTPPQTKKSNWRAKHESFMQAIRYAKKASQIEKEGGNLADLPPPPPSENPDYVQCPYCSRKFNASAAERHIPHCKNTKSRAKPPPQRR